MGVPLRRGRFFDDGDTDRSAPVVIVDETLARHFWGSTDPIGRRMYRPQSAEDLRRPGKDARWLTVVGVVGDVKTRGLVSTDGRIGAYYFPYAQDPSRRIVLAIKTAGDEDAVVAAVRRELAALDPELPLFDVETMTARMDLSLVDRRTPMRLALAFGVAALLLSAVGIYGLLAYQVTLRTREIGIRMALGGDRVAIFRLVMREVLLVLAAALAVGLTGAALLGRAMQSQLYEVRPADPRVLAAGMLVLSAVALVASGVPARRAMRVDPVTALADL
jgi:putative ABC transport system permease protein